MKICKNCTNEFLPSRKDTQYCSTQCANTFRSRTWRRKGREKELRRTPKGRYHIHKTNTQHRGIEFKLTFDEWWSLWEPYWSIDNYGSLYMCRTNDEGAYEIGNVRIDTWQNNYREARGMELV
ncbi:MAG TPA: hypothetical protein VFM18_21905 [Methanosarcina sp.]|nr:hypothetical protein [Methanosarcina sp.]